MVRDGAPRRWVHVAMTGEWLGYPDGATEFTRETFNEIIANFRRLKNKTIPVDYEHACVADPPVKAPAAGWIHELRVEGNDLYALVEFTDEAAKMIRAGEYRFNSPVVIFDSVDRKTGKEIGAELHSLALTNTPFLDGQTPIVFSRSAARRRKGRAFMKKADLLAKLGEALADFPDNIEPEQAEAALSAVIDLEAAKTGEADPPDDASADSSAPIPAMDAAPDAALTNTPDDAVRMAVVAPVDPANAAAPAVDVAIAEELMAALREAAGVTDDAALLALIRDRLPDIASLLGNTAENGTAAEASRTVTASRAVDLLRAELDNARKQLVSYKERDDKAAQASAEREVDALIAEGRVLDVKRADYVALARKDRALFVSLTKDAPPIVPLGVTKTPKPVTNGDVGDPLADVEPELRRGVQLMMSARISKDKAVAVLREQRAKRADGGN